MQALLQKMETHAATRLTLPPGTAPAQELARFKQFLKLESYRIKMLHRGGESGRGVCQARAAMMDFVVRYLWNGAKATLSAQAQKEFPPMCLVALGGYGRGELNPYSDLDLMFLHTSQVVAGGTPLPHLAKVIDGVLYPLWDLGFKVGHSVRTVSECSAEANKDMQTKTSVLEARLITGDEKLFEKLQKAVLSKCVEGHESDYIAQRLKDQAMRHEKYGNSATMQEPNIKNACGGLRDYQNLHWMAYVKYRTRTLQEMEVRELITAAERKQLESAYDFLLRVRNELHYQANRAADVLTRSLQPTVAHRLGYVDRSPCRRLEAFMRDLYHHSRNIYLINRTLEERLALLPSDKALPRLRQLLSAPFRQSKNLVVDGFKIEDGQIQPVPARVFKEQPRRLMRVFLHAQQRGLRMHPELVQTIRRQLALVDRAFLREPHVRDTFLEILNQRGSVARTLRTMHEAGLLGKYLPEFGKLTCKVQHEFYHQYAADEHTLKCIEQLDRIWQAQTPMLKKHAEVFQSLERPFILYLALLLHDAGKSLETHNHSEEGSKIATRVARRLELDALTSKTLQLLIEQHLLLAMVSQRRDLDDMDVIRQTAAQLQTTENARMLTLLTVADSQGTSDQMWTDFKDSLLWELYSKMRQVFKGGQEFAAAEHKHRAQLREGIIAALPRGISEAELDAHFKEMPARYFQIHDAREIATDLGLVHSFLQYQVADENKALKPVVYWHAEPDRGYTAVKVCTWDRQGLFSHLAGSFAAAGVNILSAQAFTRGDGIALDTFSVTDARTGGLIDRDQRTQAADVLTQGLTTSKAVDYTALIAKLRPPRTVFHSLEGEQMPTRVAFDNLAASTHTVIDVETEDRVGLLYVIAQAFARLKLNIAVAKILTEKGAAIDSFYVVDANREKITDALRQKEIEQQVKAAITSLDTLDKK